MEENTHQIGRSSPTYVSGPNASALLNDIHNFEGWSCFESGKQPAPMTRVDLDVVGRAFKHASGMMRDDVDDLPLKATLDIIRKADNTNAFLVHNVLSPEECASIIERTNSKQVPMDALYEQRYRNASRVMFRSERMAADLFSRLTTVEVAELSNWHDMYSPGEKYDETSALTSPISFELGCTRPTSALRYLEGLPTKKPIDHQSLTRTTAPSVIQKRDYVGRSPLCFGHGGVWVPLGVNECFKVFRYGEGGAFVEHRDGPWVPREDQCSMYTIVIYLNSLSAVLPEDNTSPTGGSTVLLGSSDYFTPTGSRELWSREDGITKVPPTAGTALVFNHDCWHAAEEVDQEQEDQIGKSFKYTLRTELIFQRVHHFYVDRHRFASDKTYNEARALYRSSQQALANGDRRKFAEQYQVVVSMQRNAMLNECGNSPKRALSKLSHDELAQVLLYIHDSEGILSFMLANSSTFRFIVCSPAWRAKLQTSLGIADVGPGCTTYDDDMTKYAQYCRTKSKHGGFLPSALVLLESGSLIVNPIGRPTSTRGDVYSTETGGRPDVCGIETPAHWKEDYKPVRVLSRAVSPVQDTIDEPEPMEGDNQNDLAAYLLNTRPISLSSVGTFGWSLDPSFKSQTPLNSYRLLRCPRSFGDWVYTYPFHMNAPSGERYEIGDSVDSAVSTVNGSTGYVWWDVLSVSVEVQLNASRVPLFVTSHPMWAQTDFHHQHPTPITTLPTILSMRQWKMEEETSASQNTRSIGLALPTFVQNNLALLKLSVFETLRCPALYVCHPAICVALGAAKSGVPLTNYACVNGGPGHMAIALLYGSRPFMCLLEICEGREDLDDEIKSGLSSWVDGVFVRVVQTTIGPLYSQLTEIVDAATPLDVCKVHLKYTSQINDIVNREVTRKMPELRNDDACAINEKQSRDSNIAAVRIWCGAELQTVSPPLACASTEGYPIIVAIDDTTPFGLEPNTFNRAVELFHGFATVRSLPVLVGIGSSVLMNLSRFRDMCLFRFLSDCPVHPLQIS